MPDYSKPIKNGKNAGFKQIEFASGVPLLETELNELQATLFEHIKQTAKSTLGDGIIENNDSFSLDEGVFSVSNALASVEGYIVRLTDLTMDVTDGDTIYLNVTESPIDSQDPIYEEGNLQSGDLINNYLIDSRMGQETSRRVQIQYDLTKDNTGEGVFLELGNISGETLVLTFEEIMSLKDLYLSLGTTVNYDVGENAGDVPLLNGNGKLQTSVLPALSLTETFVVANDSEMTSLTAQPGDIAIVDTGTESGNATYILSESPASTLGNWKEIMTPASVVSVNGKTGVITLNASDVGAETPSGAQSKADQAEENAKNHAEQYTDGQLDEFLEKEQYIGADIVPGINVLSAERYSQIKHKFYGNTLVNIASPEASVNQQLTNTGMNTIKSLTLTAGDYVLVKVEDIDNVDNIQLNNSSVTNYKVISVGMTKYFKLAIPSTETYYLKVDPTDNTLVSKIKIGMYRIDQATYDAIGVTLTDADVERLFPYVDGIQSVENPVLSSSGSNLAPTEIGEYEQGSLSSSNGGNVTDANKIRTVSKFNIVGNQQYSISFEQGYTGDVFFYDEDGTFIDWEFQPSIFIAPANARLARITIKKSQSTLNPSKILEYKPMINLGTRSLPFVERNSSYLYAETTLAGFQGKKDILYYNESLQNPRWEKMKWVDSLLFNGEPDYVFIEELSDRTRVRISGDYSDLPQINDDNRESKTFLSKANEAIANYGYGDGEYAYGATTFYINILHSDATGYDLTTTAGIQSYFADKNYFLTYELAEPVTEEVEVFGDDLYLEEGLNQVELQGGFDPSLGYVPENNPYPVTGNGKVEIPKNINTVVNETLKELEIHDRDIKSLQESVTEIGDYTNRQIFSSTIPDLLVFYGYPIAIENAWDVSVASEIYSQYSTIILGDGYQNPYHEEYWSTKEIIKQTKEKNKDAKIFGYIPSGVTTQNRSVSTLKTAMDQWYDLNIHGIFIDEFGYDYDNTRERQNELVDYAHSLGMLVFVNAWEPDQIYSSDNILSANPNNIPHHLNPDDYVLMESFVANDWYAEQDQYGGFAEKWTYEKYQKFYDYRKEHGTKLIGLTILDDNKPNLQHKVDVAFGASALLSLEAFGVHRTDFGAGNVSLLKYIRPEMKVGGLFYDPQAEISHGQHNGEFYARHFRDSQKGLIETITSNDNAEFDTNYPTPDEMLRGEVEAMRDDLLNRGIGENSASITGDLNDVYKNGLYAVDSGATNKPVSGSGHLIVQSSSSAFISQIYVHATNGEIYTRNKNGSSWESWTSIATEAYADQAEQNAIDWARSFGLGDQQSILTQDADLDTVRSSGFYYTYNSPNAPIPVNGILLVNSPHKDHTSQIFINKSNGAIYSRTEENGVWKPWISIEDTDGAQQKADTAEQNAKDWAKSFGLGGNAKSISGTDLNDLNETGAYSGSDLTNIPSYTGGSDVFTIVNIKHSETGRSQIALKLTNGLATFQRTQASGIWMAWEQIETTAGAQAKVDQAIDELISSSPGTLDTLNELAEALGDDPNFATTITDSLATKASKTEAQGWADDAETDAKDYADGLIENETRIWKQIHEINTATPKVLTEYDGTSSFSNRYMYIAYARIGGTGTDGNAVAVFKPNNSDTGSTGFILEKIYESGTDSNHPEFFIDANGDPSVRVFDHTTLYPVEVRIEKIRGSHFPYETKQGAQEKADEAENRSVSKSGDTMTGSLEVGGQLTVKDNSTGDTTKYGSTGILNKNGSGWKTIATEDQLHTHPNKAILDSLSDNNGQLNYGGEVIGNPNAMDKTGDTPTGTIDYNSNSNARLVLPVGLDKYAT